MSKNELTTDLSHLDSLKRLQATIHDRIRGVVAGKNAGLYLHGRPGTSKTYMVRTKLEELNASYEYSNGHLTPIGLYYLIAENRNRIIVLDDIGGIFSSKTAVQVLLGALGANHDGSIERLVRYRTAKQDMKVMFSGAIIAISNLPLSAQGHQEVLAALGDRVNTIGYEPTDEQIYAQIDAIAKKSPSGVPAKDALAVAHFLTTESRRLGVRPSIRLYVDKCLKDYGMWHSNQTESHWKDLVLGSLREDARALQYEHRDISRVEQMAMEERVAREVYLEGSSTEHRIELWHERTGKSKAALYRHLKRLTLSGSLPRELKLHVPEQTAALA
jgi:hypothetical protein